MESEPSGQFHYSSDHEEPMDTDSEADYESQAGSPVDGGHGPEDILSTRMDISDTEDPIHEKTGKRPLPPPSIRLTNNANSLKEIGDHRLVNGLANHVPLQGEIDRIVQNNTSVTRVDRDRTASLDNIKDLEQSMHSISVPLWQKILSFIPPTSLGKILRTSHLFHALLNPQGPQEIAFQMFFHGKSGFIPSEAIWQASRTRFAPGIPKPLKSKSELEMWQLIRGQTCQVCQQAKAFINAQDITNPWSSGPGDNGVRIVWLCGIRICGICLTQRCQQVWSLLFSISKFI